MTKDELEAKIRQLSDAAKDLGEPDKTFKLNDVAQLEIQVQGMALDDLRAKLDQISLPDLNQMDQQIAAARDATKMQQARVAAINKVIGLIKTGIGLAI